mgnify:CR=1 FL=1
MNGVFHPIGVFIRDLGTAHILCGGLTLLHGIGPAGFWQELVKHQIPVGHLKKSVFDLSYADFYQYDPKHGLMPLILGTSPAAQTFSMLVRR